MTTLAVKAGFTKKALIRCPAECCPVGSGGHMHLICVCGERIDYAGKGWPNMNDSKTCPKCGTQYDANGWIINADI